QSENLSDVFAGVVAIDVEYAARAGYVHHAARLRAAQSVLGFHLDRRLAGIALLSCQMLQHPAVTGLAQFTVQLVFIVCFDLAEMPSTIGEQRPGLFVGTPG